MLGDSRFLHSLRLRNFLSFGPDSEALELKSLNVLIGPNASGKSNFIEAIGLLKACAKGNLAQEVRLGGGVAEWIWKGVGNEIYAGIEVELAYPLSKGLLHHRLALGDDEYSFRVAGEELSTKSEDDGPSEE